MKYLHLPGTDISASEIILGCMRIHELDPEGAADLINTALDEGINLFDHADIYGKGRSEEVFARAVNMNPSVRDKFILQTKCGIRQDSYDFSREHTRTAVDGSLRRLKTDYIDILLLHRPDALMEPEEVAEAFSMLHLSGKVRHFGVSNQHPMQIELLAKYLDQPIIVNQLQFSLTNTGMIDAGLNVNMKLDSSVSHDGYILEYCRMKNIRIQAWSPFLFGFFDGVFIDHPKFPGLNRKMDGLANKYKVSKNAIATAWILRHPAKIQPVVGTSDPLRLRGICEASGFELSREEWYELYLSAGNALP